LKITGDDFGFTLSSNKLSEKAVEQLHKIIVHQHANNVDLALQQAEAEGKPVEDLKPDAFIHQKRLAI